MQVPLPPLVLDWQCDAFHKADQICFITLGDKVIADMQKSVEEYTPKILKLEKQLDSVTAKGKERKCEALTLEKGKVGGELPWR